MNDPAHDIVPCKPRGPRPLAWIGALVACLAAATLDWPISQWARHTRLESGLRRELEVWQQFGSVGSALLVCLVIVCVAPKRARRLLDLLAAYVLSLGAVFALKLLIGRPRPECLDPHRVLGPFQAYTVDGAAQPVYSWQAWVDGSSNLWSMPSSHTASAVVLAVFVSAFQPRLKWLVALMVLVVGFGRVMLWGHYLSDVLVGAAVSLALALSAVNGYLGVRALDALWKRLFDRSAQPALPEVMERESLAHGK